MAHLSFNDEDTPTDRWEHDRFTAYRELCEAFNDNCSKHLVPTEYLSLDETLYPMRTQISFKQYSPNKPARYGLLFKSLNDARFSCTYKTLVYAGKPISEPSEYFVKGTENYIKSLVTRVEQDLPLQGRNIPMDRLYISIATARWLLEHNVTSTCTLMTNRVRIPKEAKLVQGRADNSTRIFFLEYDEKDLVLSSYCVQISNGKKNVLMLTTKQPLLGITKDEKKKPALYKLYDFTKGGTDVIDYRMGKYSTKPESQR